MATYVRLQGNTVAEVLRGTKPLEGFLPAYKAEFVAAPKGVADTVQPGWVKQGSKLVPPPDFSIAEAPDTRSRENPFIGLDKDTLTAMLQEALKA